MQLKFNVVRALQIRTSHKYEKKWTALSISSDVLVLLDNVILPPWVLFNEKNRKTNFKRQVRTRSIKDYSYWPIDYEFRQEMK